MAEAPTLERLFDTQSIFETAVAAYLVANGLPANSTFESRGNQNMPDARIDVQYQPGAATAHQATRTTSKTGWPEQDMFSGNFIFRVQTDRPVAAAAPVSGFASIHDYWVARLKVLMLRGAINGTIAGITALTIPYHRIVVEGFSGQTPTIDLDTLDQTELAWAITAHMLPDSWPTPA
jgi:hypothetical protein